MSQLVSPGVLQLDPATGPITAIIGTFLLATLFYGFTAFLAARYVLESSPVLPAAGVGVVLASVALLLRSVGPGPVIAVSVAIDVIAIKQFYGLEWRPTALMAIAHYTLSAIIGVAVFNLVRLLTVAPT